MQHLRPPAHLLTSTPTPAPLHSLQHIFLTDGASVSVRYVLNALIRDENDAILVPIPQVGLMHGCPEFCMLALPPFRCLRSKAAARGACRDGVKEHTCALQGRAVG